MTIMSTADTWRRRKDIKSPVAPNLTTITTMLTKLQIQSDCTLYIFIARFASLLCC